MELPWRLRHTLVVLGSVLITAILALWPAWVSMAQAEQLLRTWLGLMLLLTVSFLFIGHGLNGTLFGLLIDERNRMSLSRFQLAVWTIVILAGLLSAAIWNLRAASMDPLGITIPEAVWALLGINTTSAAASPLIRSQKEKQSQDGSQAQAVLTKIAASRKNVERVETYTSPTREGKTGVLNDGTIVKFTDPNQASLGDIFGGEEVGSFFQVDIGKIQAFYFTIIIVIAYSVLLAQEFLSLAPGNKFGGFPELDPGIVVLLGISHASYLAYKAVPHSKAE